MHAMNMMSALFRKHARAANDGQPPVLTDPAASEERAWRAFGPGEGRPDRLQRPAAAAAPGLVVARGRERAPSVEFDPLLDRASNPRPLSSPAGPGLDRHALREPAPGPSASGQAAGFGFALQRDKTRPVDSEAAGEQAVQDGLAPAAALPIMDCSMLILSLGRSAQNLRELRDHLTIVPASSISHHFLDSLLRPTFDHPEYRNDFARWVGRQLQDDLLAERLAVTDPIDYPDPEHLRQHLVDLIEDRLAEIAEVPQAARGREFHFLRSQFVVIDTGLRARTPVELMAMIPALSTGSIFFHFIEARRRPPLKRDDFSIWLEGWGPELAPVCHRLTAIDYSMWSLTELRERILMCFEVDQTWRGNR